MKILCATLLAGCVLAGGAAAQPWRGAPLYHGPVFHGGVWLQGPVPYRDWQGRRQYWLDGGWRYYVPPPYRGPRHWRVTRRDGETAYELPDNVLFVLDSARISRDADSVLAEIAQAAQSRCRARVIVEGYTDTSGTREHNRALSDARARAVADALARQGVEPSRIRTVGMGETNLAVSTPDGVREAKNRRVVIRIVGRQEGRGRR